MRNMFWAAVLILVVSSAWADEIVLKNGMTVNSSITDRSDKWVKVDASGVEVTYYNDEIRSVNGQDMAAAAQNAVFAPVATALAVESAEIQLAQQTQEDVVPVSTAVPAAIEISNAPAPASAMVPATPPTNLTVAASNSSAVPSIQVTSTTANAASMHKRPVKPAELVIILIVLFVMGGVIIVVVGGPLFVIAKKTGTDYPFFAFIPILNFYLMCRIAGRPIWWMLLFFVPLVNFVVDVMVWMDIAAARKKPAWMGVLILVPFVNVAMMWYVALADA